MIYEEFRRQFSSEEAFQLALGKLSFEEAAALIEAEGCASGAKARVLSAWHDARRALILQNVRVLLTQEDELHVMFYEDESLFDENDFVYTYSLDAENTAAFLKAVHRHFEDAKTNIEAWLIETIDCSGIGSDLKDKWVQLGLHGEEHVSEDYPGGIHRDEAF